MNGKLIGLLVAALIATGTAQAKTVTIHPGSVAPGTNVSGAFAGVTLLTFSVQNLGTLPNGVPLEVPSYASVYADSVGPGQQLSSTSVFSTNASPANSEPWYGLSNGVPGSCLTACSAYDLPFLFGTVLLIEFASPVKSVTIYEEEDSYNGIYMEAFNASNQIAGHCGTSAGPPQPVGHYGCYSVLTDPQTSANQQIETSIASGGGISKILIGGYNNGVAVWKIRYTQ